MLSSRSTPPRPSRALYIATGLVSPKRSIAFLVCPIPLSPTRLFNSRDFPIAATTSTSTGGSGLRDDDERPAVPNIADKPEEELLRLPLLLPSPASPPLLVVEALVVVFVVLGLFNTAVVETLSSSTWPISRTSASSFLPLFIALVVLCFFFFGSAFEEPLVLSGEEEDEELRLELICARDGWTI